MTARRFIRTRTWARACSGSRTCTPERWPFVTSFACFGGPRSAGSGGRSRSSSISCSPRTSTSSVRSMPPTDVVIVGAGAAGLSAGGALKRLGIEPTLLDKNDLVGDSWAQRYERLHLHTVRRFSGLAHHPIPRSYPRYVPKDRYAEYLQDYAQAMQLRVELGRRVRLVRTDGNGRWEVLSDTDERWLAPVVIIATGHYNEPVLPQWPGLDEYTGRVVHSSEYVSGRDFAGQRVLVVGIGNS